MHSLLYSTVVSHVLELWVATSQIYDSSLKKITHLMTILAWVSTLWYSQSGLSLNASLKCTHESQGSHWLPCLTQRISQLHTWGTGQPLTPLLLLLFFPPISLSVSPKFICLLRMDLPDPPQWKGPSLLPKLSSSWAHLILSPRETCKATVLSVSTSSASLASPWQMGSQGISRDGQMRKHSR